MLTVLARRTCACVTFYCRHHRALRSQLTLSVEAGVVDCWRCGKRIKPGSAWDLGHDDHDTTVYRGPECHGCNRSTRSRAAKARPRRRWVL